jgi:adenylate kinase
MLCLTLSGPPGAGKTTHGVKLAAALGVPHISVGSLLRAEKDAGRLDADTIATMDRGDLVPADIVARVLAKRLDQPDAQNGFVLDGFPRRVEDMKVLDILNETHPLPQIPMVFLNVPHKEIMKRIRQRRKNGEKRDDDKPSVVKHRLHVYSKETRPVLKVYKERGMLYGVGGVGPIDVVTRRVFAAAHRALGVEIPPPPPDEPQA